MISADETQEQENVAGANEANAKAANDSQLGLGKQPNPNEGFETRPKDAQQWPASKAQPIAKKTGVLSIEDRVTNVENELADFKRRVTKKINSV